MKTKLKHVSETKRTVYAMVNVQEQLRIVNRACQAAGINGKRRSDIEAWYRVMLMPLGGQKTSAHQWNLAIYCLKYIQKNFTLVHIKYLEAGGMDVLKGKREYERAPMQYYISLPFKGVGEVKTDNNGLIVETPPQWKSLQGQHISRLLTWLSTKGDVKVERIRVIEGPAASVI